MRFTMDNAVLAKLFLPLVRGREVYGLRDIPALLKGFSYSKTAMFDEVEAPSKSITLIEGAGHFCAFTHPDQFLAALLEKVERSLPEGEGAGTAPA